MRNGYRLKNWIHLPLSEGDVTVFVCQIVSLRGFIGAEGEEHCDVYLTNGSCYHVRKPKQAILQDMITSD